MRLHFTRRIAGAEGCTRSRLGPVRIPDVHVLRSALQIHEERKRAGSSKAKIVPNLNASHTTFMSYSNLLKISYLRLVSKYQRGTANLLSSDRGQSFAQVGESTDTWAAAGLQLAAAFDSLKHGDFVGVLDVGDVVADRAKAELGLDVADSLSQCFGIAGAQDVEGQALSALTSDPGQLFQFINEPGHRLGKAGHRIFELTDLRIDKFASYKLPQFANSSITTCSQSGDAHATQHSAYGGLDGLIDFSGCLVDRGGNQVLQHLDIAGLHHLGVDLDAQKLLAAVHFHGDAAAARGGLDHSLLHFLLEHVILLACLGNHVLQIEATHGKPLKFRVSSF